MIYLWLILVIVFGVFEVTTAGLTSIWFAAGALVAMIAAALGATLWVQIAAFVVVSAVLIIFVRQIAQKFITPKIEPTNTDALIGQIGMVSEEIDNDAQSGEIKVAGKAWSARSENGEVIKCGVKVKIIRIEGVKLIVKTEV